MLELFTNAWAKNENALKQEFLNIANAEMNTYKRQSFSYKDLLSFALKNLFTVTEETCYDSPDPERVGEVCFGDYQGVNILVVGSQGYQPSTHWVTSVWYGSCSGCDALQSAHEIQDPEEWAQAHMRLVCTMIVNFKEV
jgi:hypothetical protein